VKTPSLTPKIIFEDRLILVLDKPAGLIVDRSESVKTGTLEDWLEKNYQVLSSDSQPDRAGIVHRLDKDTSGLILVAKFLEAQKKLQQQFKKRLVKKKYLVLVHGLVKPAQGQINAPVSRNVFNRRKFGVFLEGKQASTQYQVKKCFSRKNESLTLLEVFPKTGRTHQVRVHFKHLGYPVVGDIKYGGRKTVRRDLKWCPRQFLHASSLTFMHPQSGKEMTFISPLPVDLKKALESIS